MSGNVDDCSEQLSMATALSCSVVKLEQTSPTAGEPAVMKSASPTSTKKAWRQRVEMDAALAAASALATMPSVPAGGATSTESRTTSGRAPAHIQQSQLFVCRKCGKCFITLKYLEMHNALHTCQLSSAAAVQVRPSVTALVQSTPPRPPTVPVLSHVPTLPSAGSFLKAARPVPLLQSPAAPTTTSTTRYRNWTCDICRKKFSQNSSYKNHRRTHSDERPFICTICSIGFKERYHLKKHTLFKHSSETREQCKVCGKRFKGESFYSLSTDIAASSQCCYTGLQGWFNLVALHSRRTSVHGRQTFPVPCSTCS